MARANIVVHRGIGNSVAYALPRNFTLPRPLWIVANLRAGLVNLLQSTKGHGTLCGYDRRQALLHVS